MSVQPAEVFRCVYVATIKCEEEDAFDDVTSKLVITTRSEYTEKKIKSMLFFNRATKQMAGIIEGERMVIQKELDQVSLVYSSSGFEEIVTGLVKTGTIPEYGVTIGSTRDLCTLRAEVLIYAETWSFPKQDNVQRFFEKWDQGVAASDGASGQETDPMCLLAYTSTLSPEKDVDPLVSLKEISEKASANNKSLGVGGILFYSQLDGKALQFLEGAEEVVSELYDKICKDSRHYDCEVRFKRMVKRRSFKDWKMDLVSGESAELLLARLLAHFETASRPLPSRSRACCTIC